MTLARALVYFFREATVNLFRSWRISLLAVCTIGISLFVGGTVLLVVGNLSQLAEEWKREARIVVYFEPQAEPSLVAATAGGISAPWVLGVDVVSAAAARARFEESFPSLADLLEGWERQPLPASLEIAFDPLMADDEGFDGWLEGLRGRPGVQMVDDDRDWVGRLETAIRIVGGAGLVLGGVLLGAAIFTIGSVIRLTAHLYREEIGIMRLVGATELYIRGPFYVEGLLQGLVGGVLALAGLYAAYLSLAPRTGTSLWALGLARTFLPPWQQVTVVTLGAAAGLLGALLSLRRESFAGSRRRLR